MTTEQELFFRIARHLGIQVSDDGIISQIEANQAAMRLLSEQIANKEKLIDALLATAKEKSGLDFLFYMDDYFKHKRELLDLEIEYSSKHSYLYFHENPHSEKGIL